MTLYLGDYARNRGNLFNIDCQKYAEKGGFEAMINSLGRFILPMKDALVKRDKKTAAKIVETEKKELSAAEKHDERVKEILSNQALPEQGRKQLLKYIGIEYLDDESVAEFSADQALEFVTNNDHLISLSTAKDKDAVLDARDIASGKITPTMKLEFLSKAHLKFTDAGEFTLKFLFDRGIDFRVLKKDKLSRGCEQAALITQIAPYQEVKSILLKVQGSEEYFAFHLRGDEQLDMSFCNQVIAKKFPYKNLKLEKCEAEEIGLTTGRVSPFAIQWAKENSGKNVTQIFSKTLEKFPSKEAGFNFPEEFFTNLASNFLRVSFRADAMNAIMKANGAEYEEIVMSEEKAQEELEKLKKNSEEKKEAVRSVIDMGLEVDPALSQEDANIAAKAEKLEGKLQAAQKIARARSDYAQKSMGFVGSNLHSFIKSVKRNVDFVVNHISNGRAIPPFSVDAGVGFSDREVGNFWSHLKDSWYSKDAYREALGEKALIEQLYGYYPNLRNREAIEEQEGKVVLMGHNAAVDEDVVNALQKMTAAERRKLIKIDEVVLGRVGIITEMAPKFMAKQQLEAQKKLIEKEIRDLAIAEIGPNSGKQELEARIKLIKTGDSEIGKNFAEIEKSVRDLEREIEELSIDIGTGISANKPPIMVIGHSNLENRWSETAYSKIENCSCKSDISLDALIYSDLSSAAKAQSASDLAWGKIENIVKESEAEIVIIGSTELDDLVADQGIDVLKKLTNKDGKSVALISPTLALAINVARELYPSLVEEEKSRLAGIGKAICHQERVPDEKAQEVFVGNAVAVKKEKNIKGKGEEISSSISESSEPLTKSKFRDETKAVKLGDVGKSNSLGEMEH